MSEEIKNALDVLTKAIHDDPDYAWSWHCNLSMHQYDAMIKYINRKNFNLHKICNEGAARFMSTLFDIDMTQHKNYISFIEQWNALSINEYEKMPDITLDTQIKDNIDEALEEELRDNLNIGAKLL